MMSLKKKYNNIVLNGRIPFILFFLTAIVLRIVFLVFSPYPVMDHSNSYLLTKLIDQINSPYVSVILSFIALSILALFVNSASISVSLFRIKTILPIAIAFFVFSIYFLYFSFSSSIVLGLLFAYIIYVIYNNYEAENIEYNCLRVGFYTSLACLASPVVVYYIPILWCCLYLSRSISAKGIVAFILGCLPTYILVISFSLFNNDFTAFTSNAGSVFKLEWSNLPIFQFSLLQYIFLVLCIIIMILLTINNRLRSFGESVINRVCLNILSLLQIFSIFIMVFVPNGFNDAFTIILVTYCLSLSYILISGSNKKLLFILLLIGYIGVISLSIYQLFYI